MTRCLQQLKPFDGTNRQTFEDWIDKVDQACRASKRIQDRAVQEVS